MPEQDPNVRNNNFLEVCWAIPPKWPINEAKRCLHCKKPLCVEGCPVNVRIPEFIRRSPRAISPPR
jgi:glutamate synthase (NADPH/NADH) small chain